MPIELVTVKQPGGLGSQRRADAVFSSEIPAFAGGSEEEEAVPVRSAHK